MHPKSPKLRFIAVFVMAFVCLNAAGALCVAYCQAVLEKASTSADHCPLKKKLAHCNPAASENDTSEASAGSTQLDCCTMTLGFVGAPIEKKGSWKEVPAEVVSTPLRIEPPALRYRAISRLSVTYRGPPLDRRVERLKNCIIRI